MSRDPRGSEPDNDNDDVIRRDGTERSDSSNLPNGTVALQRATKPMEPKLSAAFLRRLIMARGSQLTKLRVHGLAASLKQLEEVCSGCPQLRDLVLQLYESDKVSVC